MNPHAPIRRLTFYKHGVAQVVRETNFTGDELRIVLRDSELDDALKSLAVFNRSTGSVVSVDYCSPQRSSNSGVLVGPQAVSLRPGQAVSDLLEQWVGWHVEVSTPQVAAGLAGRIVGLQRDGEDAIRTLLLQIDATGELRSLRLDDIDSISPTEPEMAQRLQRMLDARQQPDGQQQVGLRLTAGDHQLRLAYLVPCPAWRVSYRVFVDDALDSSDTHAVRLQGWGVIDNTFGEDVTDAVVSLVAGQPISFRYALTQPELPPRVTVKDVSRPAVAPMGFDPAVGEDGDERVDLNMSAKSLELMPPMAPPVRAMRAMASEPEEYAITPSQGTAEANDIGALFAYRVAAPVSIPQGRSGLLPLMDLSLPGRAVLLFNETKYRAHPIRTVLCRNDSPFVLERGPVTLSQGDDYVGEALVPFTSAGAELYLPYAIELGVSIIQSRAESHSAIGLRTGSEGLVAVSSVSSTVKWTIESRVGRDEEVTVECHRSLLAGDLDPATPAAETAGSVYRWKVHCPANKRTLFQVRSVHVVDTRIEASTINAGVLRLMRQKGQLIGDAAAGLSALLEAYEALDRVRREEAEVGRKLADARDELQETREAMDVLDEQTEQDLRRELANDMMAAMRKVDALKQKLEAVRQRREELEAGVASRQAGVLGVGSALK